MHRKIDNLFKSENGSGLVLSLMVLLVLSVLGSMLGVVTIGSYRLGNVNQDSMSAYYIAEAGANMAYEEIKNSVMDAYNETDSVDTFYNSENGLKGIIDDINGTEYSNGIFSYQNGDQPSANIHIEGSNDEGTDRQYVITSIGEVEGRERTVSKPFNLTYIESVEGGGYIPSLQKDNAVILKDNLNAIAAGGIKGNILYTGNGEINHPRWIFRHLGRKIMDENLDWSIYNNILGSFPEEPDYQKTIEHTWRPLTITENTYIPKLNSIILENLIIDTQDKDVYLIVNEVDLNGVINVKVKGTGTLNIYVRNEMEITGLSELNKIGSESQLNFLYRGDDPVRFSGVTYLNASLFVHHANIIFGGFSRITDGIISGGNRVTLIGDSKLDSIIYAPHANVSMAGNSEMEGIILAKNLNFLGIATVNYSDRFIGDFYYYSPNAEVPPTIDNLISAEPAIEQ